MRKLTQRLTEWTERGLINPEQARNIEAYEQTKPESSWVMSGLLVLGVTVTGIGVVSVIAANWDRIADAAKLGIDFALLALLAFVAHNFWRRGRDIAFEVTLLGFVLLCLASIGLISQVFHTVGELYEALLYWCAITSLACFTTRTAYLPFVWSSGLFAALFMAGVTNLNLRELYREHPWGLFFSLATLAIVLATASARLTRREGPSQAFRVWVVMSGVVALGAAELQVLDRKSFEIVYAGYLPGLVFTGIAACLIALSPVYSRVQRMVLLGALAGLAAAFHIPYLGLHSKVVQALLTIGTIGAFGLFAASRSHQRLFQLLLALVGLRFLILYFQALGGLARTGFGLIVSGGVVIGLALAYNRYRNPLAKWVERQVQ